MATNTATAAADARLDRLYRLLPAIYRMRDVEQQYQLQALLRVIAEQVNIVEDDITRLYENWFIETADAWVVPYIGDLIGYRPVRDAGAGGDVTTQEGLALSRILTPRREVANTIRYRRRKGTLAVLELLANDVAGWPARAVEFFKLLGWNQNINHLHLERASTVDVRRMDDLDLIDGPFDRLAHSVDVRRISSPRTVGRYNIPSVGVFVWRLKSYSVTHSPAYCAENAGPHCCAFSVLSQDAPLFVKPEAELAPSGVAGELNLPAPIRRRAFDEDKELYYGEDKSFAIFVDGWAGYDGPQPLPPEFIIPSDLTGWQYVPPLGHIAVDPVLGRIAFPPSQLPKRGVRVTYHYGFSVDMGGGEYSRQIFDPAPQPSTSEGEAASPTYYYVGKDRPFQRVGDALQQWRQDKPRDAVIEITESGVYAEPFFIELSEKQTLQLRAGNRVRPIIRLLDWQTDLPDAFTVTMGKGSRFALDGLLITGRAVNINGQQSDSSQTVMCGSRVTIRHCTLVPGWGIDCDAEPLRPAEPSLELYNVRAHVDIEHSIVGSIQVHEDEVKHDPIPFCISDSIVDATDPGKEAIGAPGYAVAHAILTIRRCTVFGIVDVHAMELAENCIFSACVNVARRQLGCMRFCYVPPGCRTPRRYHCQPDLVEQDIKDRITDVTERDNAIARDRLRLRPQFTSVRYGNPAYAQLALTCADEIKTGADDESEMGAFHDLFQPQRAANLRVRLDEYTPAGMDAGIIYVT
jgi:hypothetical protein